MAKKKEGRPSWFKMFLHQKALVDSVSDETAGMALKAAFRYFDNEEVGELDPLAFAVFSAIKPYIDESFADFQATSEKNKENIKKRWANRAIPNDTTCTTGNHSIPNIPSDTKNTEAEAEAEAEERAITVDDSQAKNTAAIAVSAEGAPAVDQGNESDFNSLRNQAIQKLKNHPEG